MLARDFLKRLWVLMATIFVDMMGHLIVLPLLPFYAEKIGASPSAIGALVAAFAMAQLAAAPFWGRLSDRYGRRPMILGGLLLSAAAYILFESAYTVWLLLLSRLVQGAGGGTVAVVQAYLSDEVPGEDRAKALGWLTTATSAGVMIGPAIGSLAAAYGKIGPGYLAALLCGVNFLFAWWWLPETSPRRAPGERPRVKRGETRRAILEVLRNPRGPVGAVVWIYAMGMMAFMAMNGVLALFLERRFGVTVATIGWFYVYVGAISVIMRALVLGPVVRRFGEVRTLRLGALSIALGLAAISFSTTIAQLAVAVMMVPVGTALLFPTTTSLVSRRAPAGSTGLLLGVNQTFGGVARMVGPLWSGVAFEHLGVPQPFWIAAGLMVAVRLFASVVVPERRPVAASRPEAALPTEPS